MFAFLRVFVSLVLQSQVSSVILLLLLCAVRFAGRRQGLRGHETMYCELGIEGRRKDGLPPFPAPSRHKAHMAVLHPLQVLDREQRWHQGFLPALGPHHV